jgi:hypothetical protein
MKEDLTKEIAYKALQEFFSKDPMVLFGTGTSIVLDPRFGMTALRKYLMANVVNSGLTAEQNVQWKRACDSLGQNGGNFEKAMDDVQDENLVRIIINLTANFLKVLDKEYSIKILNGEAEWVALDLLKRMVDRLPGSRSLHVATPNYDLLAEYALEKNDVVYITGYAGGVCRVLDWTQSEMSARHFETTLTKGKPTRTLKYKKHIRLYKLHGSLNTFCINNRIVENNAWIHDVPENVERLMITPGATKHKFLHNHRSELLGCFDDAVKKHSAFLFIGFGFNDTQIVNTALLCKLKEQSCHGLIITRDSNDRIEEILRDCKNLWLVCKNQEEGNNGTRIFNSCYDNWLYIDEQIWDCKVFTKQILGG